MLRWSVRAKREAELREVIHSSHSPKLTFEIVAAEKQRRWPAVWTMMRIVGQLALLDERGHLFRRQAVTGADGGMAGHQAHQIVEKHFAARRAFLGNEVIDDGAEDRLRRATAKQGGIARYQNRAATEILDAETQLRQCIAVFQRPRRLLGGQLDRLRDQQWLRFQWSRLDAAFDLLEQDAFVQGVLIDDQHALIGFDDEIRIIELNDLRRRMCCYRLGRWRLRSSFHRSGKTG